MKYILLYLFISLFSQFVWSQGITYHGRLADGSGNLVTASSVQFLIEIRSPGAENCLMYSETQTKNLSTTSGKMDILSRLMLE